MSYSFSVKANSKAEVKVLAAAELDKIVLAQPIHKADKESALVAINIFIDLLGEPEVNDEVFVSVSGSLSWHGDMANADFIGANIAVSTRIQNKA